MPEEIHVNPRRKGKYVIRGGLFNDWKWICIMCVQNTQVTRSGFAGNSSASSTHPINFEYNNLCMRVYNLKYCRQLGFT